MKIVVISSAEQPGPVADPTQDSKHSTHAGAVSVRDNEHTAGAGTVIVQDGESSALSQKADEIKGSNIFPAATGLEWVRVANPGEAERQQAVDLYLDLDFTMEQGRMAALSRLLPAPVLIHSVVTTLKEIQQPFIRINAWPGFLERSIHELVSPDEATAQMIGAIYKKLNKQYRFVPDIPGMISGRILATIINEAYYTLQEEVSTAPEIDTAMKLGTNYPRGPFEWCGKIGPGNIEELLTRLSKTESRYTPATALKKAAKEIKIGLKNN
jgi:3-hydroxybutyryl-CoA dehydrogenase